MSVCANIFVQFSSTPSNSRIESILELISNRTQVPVSTDEVYDRLVKYKGRVSVNSSGELELDVRGSKVPNIYLMSYLSRFWSKNYADGELMHYAITLLTLLNQSDVEYVWYTDDNYNNSTLPNFDVAAVHGLIDDFINVGEMSFGKPTKYIRTEVGVINT